MVKAITKRILFPGAQICANVAPWVRSRSSLSAAVISAISSMTLESVGSRFRATRGRQLPFHKAKE